MNQRSGCRRAAALVVLAVLLASVPAAADAELYRTLMKRGNRYFRNELYRDAEENYRAALQKHRALEPYFNRGAALYKNGRYRNAVEAFHQALSYAEKPEERADIHYNLGNSYFMLENYQEAVAQYREGLKQDPGDLNMKYNLELALRNLQRLERERESLREEEGEEEGGESPAPGDEREQDPAVREEVAGEAGEGGEPSESPRQGGRLTPQEAASLINAVNNDQGRVMREIIRRKTGAADEEQGW